jgi:hypothetical protein
MERYGSLPHSNSLRTDKERNNLFETLLKYEPAEFSDKYSSKQGLEQGTLNLQRLNKQDELSKLKKLMVFPESTLKATCGYRELRVKAIMPFHSAPV